MSHNFTPLIIKPIGSPSGLPTPCIGPQDDGVEALIGYREGRGMGPAGGWPGQLMGPRGGEGNCCGQRWRPDEREAINFLLHFVGATKLFSVGSFSETWARWRHLRVWRAAQLFPAAAGWISAIGYISNGYSFNWNSQNSTPFHHLLCLLLRELRCFLWFSFRAFKWNVPLWGKKPKIDRSIKIFIHISLPEGLPAYVW